MVIRHVLVGVESVLCEEGLVPEADTQLSWREITPSQVKTDVGSKLLEAAARTQARDPDEGIRVVEISCIQGVCVINCPIRSLVSEARRVMIHELHNVEGPASEEDIAKLLREVPLPTMLRHYYDEVVAIKLLYLNRMAEKMNYLFGHCMSNRELVGVFVLLEVVYTRSH